MNKLIGIVLALSLAFIVSAASVAPALAASTDTEHLATTGVAFVDVSGHPQIMITFAHFDWGDHGPGNSIGIWEWFPPLNRMMIVAWIRNAEGQYNWAKELVSGMPTLVQQVKGCQLQVYRVGKVATAVWTFAIVVPEEKWVSPAGTYVTPAVTVPPGCLLLKGYDDVRTGVESAAYPSGWSGSTPWTGFSAHATFMCPSWHYCGPVGLNVDNQVRVDATATLTHA
jgi:hypothetical protein